MTSVSVVIPYAGDCPHRNRALGYVARRYEALGWQVIIACTTGEWCKARAVAEGLTTASGDLLVVADADVWADKIERCAWWVTVGAVPWAQPYRFVYRLTEEATGQVYAGAPFSRSLGRERFHDATVGGGIVVIPRAAYETCPLDARFVGWGGEDRAWGLALTRLVGEPGRMSGHCWHLYHPLAYRKADLYGLTASEANTALLDRYERAARNTDLMRDLVGERCSVTRPSFSDGSRPAAETPTGHR